MTSLFRKAKELYLVKHEKGKISRYEETYSGIVPKVDREFARSILERDPESRAVLDSFFWSTIIASLLLTSVDHVIRIPSVQ